MKFLKSRKFQRIAAMVLSVILVVTLCSCSETKGEIKDETTKVQESKTSEKKDTDLLKYMDGYNEGYDTGYYEGYNKGVQDIYNQLSEAGYDNIVKELKKMQQ